MLPFISVPAMRFAWRMASGTLSTWTIVPALPLLPVSTSGFTKALPPHSLNTFLSSERFAEPSI
jgi:hypothetical protein